MAQTQNLIFIGVAKVKGSVSYSYKLQFTDSANKIYGYSVTDVMGPNETKTEVLGTIDNDKQKLSFRERKIIYTKSKESKDNFCYLHADLKITNIKGATALKGHFTGYKEDAKTVCAKGELLLFSANDVLDQLLKIAPKRDSVEKADSSKIEHRENSNITNVIKLAPGKTFDLHCPSNTLNLEVWDDKNIDGDIITIMQNTKYILQNYTLQRDHRLLHIDLSANQTDTLKVIAINEGSEPTNTARIKITSGNMTQYIDATTTISTPVYIYLKQDSRK
ncbi:MAG: hypothetical protein WCG87_00280 [Bacteroidota bacterium]